MSVAHIATPTPLGGPATEPSETHLRGRWLLLARLVCAGVVAFALTLFVASLPIAFTQMRSVCAPLCLPGQLTAAQAHSLRQLGISLDAYAAFELAFTILTSLVWFTLAAVVFWRRSDNLVTLLVAVQLVTQGATVGTNALFGGHSTWAYPAAILTVLNGILFSLFLAVFPNGRFAPRWMGWVLIPASAVLCAQVLPGAPQVLLQALAIGAGHGIVFPLLLAILIAAQFYRYRYVSTSIQRQQTKWIILGLAASLLIQLALVIPPALAPSLSAPDALYPLLVGIVTSLAFLLGPIAFMFAVLRYRLYDIDILVRRTLVYGSLTAILAAIYFAVVLSAQAVVQGITGQTGQQPVIIVASTLLIAALFNPLRRRFQSTIDRRFYRRRYDAKRTLEAFGATLRTETDLTQLSEHLVAVVQETMQPENVSLWLRAPAPAQRQERLP